ncbi:hypothetical protein NMG60_11003978 [Bertholletia excelsa]
MKKSPIYPGHDGGDYDFDPQADFLQFLEEARRHASQENVEADLYFHPGEAQMGRSDEVKRSKRSWKRSVFSWFKSEKKSNSSMAPPTSFHVSKPRRGHVSGPIHTNGGGGSSDKDKPRRPMSGPLKGLFQSTKKTESGIPYMCLDKLTSPHGVQSYGPVYLVT